MLSARLVLLALLGLLAAAFVAVWGRAVWAARGAGPDRGGGRFPSPWHVAVGAVTNFFDTLGIGSYATTTSIFRLGRMLPDRHIPGTLNVGHTIPTFVEAFIYMSIVEVEMKTLILMIAASVAGAWLGAGVVARWPKRRIQAGMGGALLAAALLMAGRALDLLPGGGASLGLSGWLLAAGLCGNFVFGALMTIGIGAYAPIMILVSLLGMNPTAAFPIMMGSCAFLMPVASFEFIRRRSYSLRPALGLAVGGAPAVLLAAFLVKSLKLDTVRWLVVGVVVYTAAAMLRSALAERAPEPARRGP